MEGPALHEDQYTFLIIYHSVLLKMRNISDTNCRENQNINFMISNFFPPKFVPLWDKVEKYCTTTQAIDDNMAHARCIPDMQGYKQHTHRICNIYCFSTVTMVTRTRLNVTSQEHCLHCLLLAPTNRWSKFPPETALLYVCPLSQLSNVYVARTLCYFRPSHYYAVLHPTISVNAEAHARTWDAGATLEPVSSRFWNTGYATWGDI